MKIIVTGASRGIGRGIATALAKEGFQVGALARSSTLLDELRTEIEAARGICHTAVCDLRDPSATQSAIASLREQLGAVGRPRRPGMWPQDSNVPCAPNTNVPLKARGGPRCRQRQD